MSYPTNEPPHFSATVMKRARGVWLVDFTNHETGDLEYDAFATEAKAKRWANEQANQRLTWKDMNSWMKAEGWWEK